MGFVFKSGFVLPMNASDFWAYSSNPFSETSHPITVFQRSIVDSDATKGFDEEQMEKYEKYQVKADIVESGTEANIDSAENSDQIDHLASTRWLVYKGLAEIAEQ